MTRTPYLRTAALLALIVVGAQAPDLAAVRQKTQAQRAVSETYRIGPHDVLDVSVWNNDKLSRTVPVRPDGLISLPLLQDVQAAGLTATELAQQIRDKLSQYVESPEVAVIVSEVNSYTFSVMGHVREPGRFPLRGKVSVVDALAEAGGFTDFASPAKMFVIRASAATKGGTTQRIPYNYRSLVLHAKRQTPLFLQPGDVVVVP
jgi:polysaccharide biosynthesis/export protein